jgi:hypothetical protein
MLVFFEHFIKIFRNQQIFLPAVGAMNLPASADTGTAGLFPDHVQIQFVLAKTAFHARNPVV